jgi:hypothetical protein
MEWWSDGVETHYSNTPILQHSVSGARLVSKIVLISPQAFFSDPLIDRALRQKRV